MPALSIALSRPLAALLCLTPIAAGAAFPTLYLKPVVVKQIHSPTTITHAPDGSGRIFVCDQPGKIYVIDGGMLIPTPFLNIASSANPAPNNGPGPVVSVTTGYSERGLLGLTFHPGFANPASPGYRKFYVNYNKPYEAGVDPPPPVADHTPNCTTVIAEFEVSATNPNLAVPASERRLLLFTQPQSNHNGGQVEFGPDGFLYIGCGDGGSQDDNNVGHTGGSSTSPRPTNNLGNSQDKTRLLGKILRINPADPDGAGPLTYSIPASNPFVGAGGGVKEEIYAFGLRNPWKFSFDKRAPDGTNRLFCGDVGGARTEEVDLIVSGGNYGWRYLEGTENPTFSSGAPVNPMPHPGGSMISPIAQYAHAGQTVGSPALPQLGPSVTGGFVYRGAAIPALQGKYVFGDYGSSTGRLMGLEETAPNSGTFTLTQAVPLLGGNPIPAQHILCFGEDESGEIYVGLKTNGGVLALDNGLPAGGIYKIVAAESGSSTVGPSLDNTIFSEDVDLSRSYSDGRGYIFAGRTGTNFGPYVRRGLIAFDVAAAVPAGSTIQSAQVKLNLNKPGPSGVGTTLALHRLNQTWGEGTSVNPSQGFGAPATTGDATWTHRFYNTSSWTNPGGTFQPAASATATAAFGLVTWNSSTQLVSDVQGWINSPATNAGWILRGNEVGEETACRFDSGELGSTAPSLALTYQSPPPPTHFENWLSMNFPGLVAGQWVDPSGDIDGDSVRNQIEYAYGLSATAYDYETNFSTVLAPAAGGATNLTVTFRRDPNATDLTYRLQTSTDLLNWTTIAQSSAGGNAVGQNGGTVLSDALLAGEPSIRLVTVRQTLPPGTVQKFVRLRVDRQP